MNLELQKSLQVSALSNVLDSYMAMVLVIMVSAGLLGGLANYYLAERHGERKRRELGKFLVLGAVAALTVPLFLNMISSNLLEAARTRPVDFFVFAGFCLIYVVASRRVFENVANRVFGQAESSNRVTAPPSVQSAGFAPVVTEATPSPVATSDAKQEVTRDALSYNDVEILRALSEDNYIFGNLAALTDKTGVARDVVSTRLSVLKNIGIIETRINDKGVLHWLVSPKGKQLLAEVLSGQEER